MNKIKKGDEVIVIAGKDKGRRGVVLSIPKDGETLVVEGVNTAMRHTKPNPNSGDKGGIVVKTKPIQRSNVMLYNPISGKGSKVGIRTLEDGRKARYFKDTNELVEA